MNMYDTLVTPDFSKTATIRRHAATYSAAVPDSTEPAPSGSWLNVKKIGAPNVCRRCAHREMSP